MRRRRVLAALATGLASASAGCGYAYGGGDVRDTGSFRSRGGPWTDRLYAVGDDRIAVASTGEQWLFGEPGEEPTRTDATTLAVARRDLDERWSYTHRERSRAVALGDLAYLLEEGGRVIAVEAERVETDRGSSVEADEAWQAAVGGRTEGLTADATGAYVAGDGELAAVRDGAVAWTADIPSPVRSLDAVGGTVLVRTDGLVLAVGADGTERWRVETGRSVTPASAAGRTVLAGEDGEPTAVRTDTGERLWSATVGGWHDTTLTADAAYLVTSGGVRALDAATGDSLWSADAGVSTPLVGAPEGVYAVRNCEAVAVGSEGVRWTRALDTGGGCAVVDGWLDGQTVRFWFESGDAVALQRTDQDRGLL